MKKSLSAQRLFGATFLALIGLAGLASAESWYYFPMAADGVYGAYGQGFGYCTRYTLIGETTTRATLVFRKPDGTALNMTLHCPEIPSLNGSHSSFSIDFSQSSSQTVSLYTWGEYALQTGWASVTANEPLKSINSAYCFYKYQLRSPIVWEAVVFPAEASTQFYTEANVSQQEPWDDMVVDTGIAVVNPHNYAIDVTVYLGNVSPIPTKVITLPAYGQQAVYLSSLFPDFSFGVRYVDRVRISCADHFLAMGMRALTISGQTICSTLPVTPLRVSNSYQLTQRKPNGNNNTANDISFLTAHEAMVIGSFKSTSTERGSYHVYLPAGVRLTVHFLGYYLGSNARCTDLQVWDSTFQLASGTVTSGVHGNEASLTFVPSVSGDYYIDVVGRKSMIYNASDYLLFFHYE